MKHFIPAMLLAAVLLAGCQTDGQDSAGFAPPQGSLFDGVGVVPAITLPPRQYDKPCPECEVFAFDYWEVHERCTGFKPSPSQGRVEGCYKKQGPWHIVIVPKAGSAGVTQAQHEALVRHEIGHRWGWPQSHEGARYPKGEL
jgi:hypothetical protein